MKYHFLQWNYRIINGVQEGIKNIKKKQRYFEILVGWVVVDILLIF